MTTFKLIIEQLVEQEIQEVNAIAAGGVSATGGSPLGADMEPAHDKMWSGGVKEAVEEIIESVFQEFKKPKLRLGESLAKLLEGKIDTEMKRFEADPNMTAFLGALKLNSVAPKYVPWLIKIAQRGEVLVNRTPEQAKNIASSWLQKVNRFDKMTQLNQMPLDKRDINKYEDLEDLMQWTDAAEKKYQEKSKEKQAVKASDKVYEDGEYLIIEPKSKEASCAYGKGTQWCISATQSQNYYDQYAEQGARFLFIINKKTNDKDAIAFAGDIDQIEIYDAEDDAKQPVYIENKYSKPILELLNGFLNPIIGVEPFSTISMEDIKRDPRALLNWSLLQKFVDNDPVNNGLNSLELLAYAPKDGWTNTEQGYAAQRVRWGMERILMKPILDPKIARRLLKIHKSNPREFVLTRTALKILAVKIIAAAEYQWSDDMLVPLVFDPLSMRAILGYFLQDPVNNIGHLGRVIGIIEKIRTRIPDEKYHSSRRTWELNNESLATGDADVKYNRTRNIKVLVEIGEKYNWDFDGAIMAGSF